MKIMRIAFCTSGYNEEGSVTRFIDECRRVAVMIKCDAISEVQTSMFYADNKSTDKTLARLLEQREKHGDVIILANAMNYGPDRSIASCIKLAAEENDLIIAMCSDLQDPPSLSYEMIREMLCDNDLDAVMACKVKSDGGKRLRFMRRLYYTLLDRVVGAGVVPQGFHGYGCYRADIARSYIDYYEQKRVPLRQCIAEVAVIRRHIYYTQEKRYSGASSYNMRRYIMEALRSIGMSRKLPSKVSIAGLVLCLMGFFVIGAGMAVNLLLNGSLIGTGIPTIAMLLQMNFMIVLTVLVLQVNQLERAAGGRGARSLSRYKLIR